METQLVLKQTTGSTPAGLMRVVGYVRVSTDEQAREGVSLDAQETRIKAYCEAKGWDLVGIVHDEGRSGKDLRRPGLQGMLADLPRRQRAFDILAVVKLDRLTRSVKDLATLMDAFKRARVEFTAIQEAVDTTSASGELFLNIIGALSQWERKAIGERTAAAMQHMKSQGLRVSRFPSYGWRFAEGGRLEPDQREQAVVRQVAALKAQGLSLRTISKALAARGVMARSGRPFAPGVVLSIVRNGSSVPQGTVGNTALGEPVAPSGGTWRSQRSVRGADLRPARS